jgi:hypothetical protein
MSGFSMKVSNDKLEGLDVVPPGPYDIKLVGFNVKVSKKGDSFNLNPCMEIVGHPEFAGRKVFDTLNSGGAWTWPDFVHCFGLPMETDGKESWIPGSWDGDKAKYKADDPNTWKYAGPLLGRSGKVNIAVDNYNGKDSNKVERYICAVPDCASKFPKIRHIADLLKRK